MAREGANSGTSSCGAIVLSYFTENATGIHTFLTKPACGLDIEAYCIWKSYEPCKQLGIYKCLNKMCKTPEM